MTMWGRSAATRDNPMYHVLEPIAAQSYTSRVVALFYAAPDAVTSSKLKGFALLQCLEARGRLRQETC